MNKKLSNIIGQTTGLIMKNFTGNVIFCKTPNCNKEIWMDGYCKKCANYIMQKSMLESLNNNVKLLESLTVNIQNIETKIDNIDLNNNHYENNQTNLNKSKTITTTKIISKPKKEEFFIPSININTTEESKIVNTKSVVMRRNISDTVSKLQDI